MPIRYYPLSKIRSGKTPGNEFTINGVPYKGDYYQTFDGEFFSGKNPIVGKNERLTRVIDPKSAMYPKSVIDKQKKSITLITENVNIDLNSITTPVFNQPKFKGVPTSYNPIPIDNDYNKGYINRYFIKKSNSNGYVTEISPEEYVAVQNGAVPYDVSFWQAIEVFWKLTGPLKSKRISQYQVRAGIIDTNERLIETANKTFFGLKEFIAGDYSKFARPTE